jgi:hypothetical protein
LAFFRPFYYADFEKFPGRGAETFRLQPVIRFLYEFAGPVVSSHAIDVAIHALEEIIRLDHEDHYFARELLVLAYIKVIGRRKREQTLPIDRSIDHLTKLVDCHFSDSEFPLFDTEPSTCTWYNEDLMILRWKDVFMAFFDGDENWKTLVLEEQKRCPWIFSFLFDETGKIPFPDICDSPVVRNANRMCEMLAVCFYDWPDMMLEMYHLVRTRYSPEFERKIQRMTPCIRNEYRRDGKWQMSEISTSFLDNGRSALMTGNYAEAFALLTLARRYYGEAMRPGARWYLGAPWQIVSNRALAEERLSLWSLCRSDTRFTLFLRNDHIKSYERLPKIAESCGALELAKELERFVWEVKKGAEGRGSGEWRKLARKGVALVSVSAMMLSKMGMLTKEKREELYRVGIDDMYTSVNVTCDLLPTLPWLSDDDRDSP